MVLRTYHTVDNYVYTTTIEAVEMGTSELSAAEEREILNNTPPTLRYKDIRFVGNVTMGNDHLPALVTAAEPAEGTYDVVRLDLVDKEVPITPDFSVSYSVDSKKLARYATTKNKLQDAEDIAMAQLLVFEKCVIDKVTELVQGVRIHTLDFEDQIAEYTI